MATRVPAPPASESSGHGQGPRTAPRLGAQDTETSPAAGGARPRAPQRAGARLHAPATGPAPLRDSPGYRQAQTPRPQPRRAGAAHCTQGTARHRCGPAACRARLEVLVFQHGAHHQLLVAEVPEGSHVEGHVGEHNQVLQESEDGVNWQGKHSGLVGCLTCRTAPDLPPGLGELWGQVPGLQGRGAGVGPRAPAQPSGAERGRHVHTSGPAVPVVVEVDTHGKREGDEGEEEEQLLPLVRLALLEETEGTSSQPGRPHGPGAGSGPVTAHAAPWGHGQPPAPHRALALPASWERFPQQSSRWHPGKGQRHSQTWILQPWEWGIHQRGQPVPRGRHHTSRSRARARVPGEHQHRGGTQAEDTGMPPTAPRAALVVIPAAEWEGNFPLA